MRVLYVSQNGIAENLGQSQVLPYLRGLSSLGADIQLVSFELPTITSRTRDEISAQLAESGIKWVPLSRQPGTTLLRKFGEAMTGTLASLRTALGHRPHIVHGRSYFATAICDLVAELTRRPALLFDCRGMIGDEYVDAGHWTKGRLEYRVLKKYERRIFRRSDGVVVLTRALAAWLKSEALLGPRPILEVVPCCVDTSKFRPLAEARTRRRRELGIDDALVLVYSGSLGSWYLEEEMAQFAAAVRESYNEPNRAALRRGPLKRVAVACFTPSRADGFVAALARNGFTEKDVVVQRIQPSLIAEYLSAGDVGLSFIKPCFSKMGSSPTKVAEYLACGNVAALNVDIGDQADLITEGDACVGLRGFSASDLRSAAQRAVALATLPLEERVVSTSAVAKKHFGLEEVGVPRYARLYDSLISARSAGLADSLVR